jgi:hypothetical protein
MKDDGAWCCEEAREAANTGRLRWWRERKAWVERSMPLRSDSALAVFQHQQGLSEEPSHQGEPYTLVDCPLCGGVIPLP